MKGIKIHLFFCGLFLFLIACESDPMENPPSNSGAKLKVRFNFDETQVRLNNLGMPATIPQGNAAQTPLFKSMSAHFIELVENQFTPVGNGVEIYKGAETTAGGDLAINFDEAIVAQEGEIFLEIPLSAISPGVYEHSRVSVSYQNFDMRYNLINLPTNFCPSQNQSGTLASFVGFNTYISTITPRSTAVQVNDDRLQGFWAFETDLSSPCDVYNQTIMGQAPEGSTTVVNPLFQTASVPPGSCVVTGSFDTPLEITGNETEDILITLSFSVNNSLEWQDLNSNGELDFDVTTPSNSDRIVDMGLRGLIPSWE